jgi:hypothetical protein
MKVRKKISSVKPKEDPVLRTARKFYDEAKEVKGKETTFTKAVKIALLPDNFHTMEDLHEVMNHLARIHKEQK